MDNLDAHIERVPAIAAFLQIHPRTVLRLIKGGALESAVMRKKVRRVCTDGKVRWYRIYYSTGRLLMAWQVARGGLERVKKSPG